MRHDEVVAKNAAWWAAHPDFKAPTATAQSLARSVVHWHHNVESRRRYEGRDAAESDEYFRRRYAIEATKAWLVETRSKLDALGPSKPATWYQRRDLEVEIRVLQHALDDFEWNTRNHYGK